MSVCEIFFIVLRWNTGKTNEIFFPLSFFFLILSGIEDQIMGRQETSTEMNTYDPGILIPGVQGIQELNRQFHHTDQALEKMLRLAYRFISFKWVVYRMFEVTVGGERMLLLVLLIFIVELYSDYATARERWSIE